MNYQTLALLETLLAMPHATAEASRMLLASEEGRKLLGTSWQVPPHVLAQLATAEVDVRLALASNPCAPVDTLLTLAHDRSSRVREAARSTAPSLFGEQALLTLPPVSAEAARMLTDRIEGYEDAHLAVRVLLDPDWRHDGSVSPAARRALRTYPALELLRSAGVPEPERVLLGSATSIAEFADVLFEAYNCHDYDVVAELAVDLDPFVDRLVAAGGGSRRLATSDDPYIRQLIAALPSTPPAVLRLLVTDYDGDVTRQAMGNPGTSLEDVLSALESNPRQLATVVSVLPALNDAEQVDALLEAGNGVVLAAVLAGHLDRTVTEDLLSRGARSPWALARMHAARHPQLPEGLALELAADPEWEVSMAVLERPDVTGAMVVAHAHAHSIDWGLVDRLTDDEVVLLPWSSVGPLLASEYLSFDQRRIRDVTLAALDGALRAHPQGLETFMALEADFAGSTLDLLGAVRHL